MKAFAILGLRVSTGLLLVMWGFIKVGASENAISVSDRYYGGALSAEAIQAPLGLAQIALGLLVCLGILRRFTYPLQALVLILGAVAIWKYLADPLGLYLVDADSRRPLFFPSLCVAFATLIPILFKSEDALSLDRKLGLKF